MIFFIHRVQDIFCLYMYEMRAEVSDTDFRIEFELYNVYYILHFEKYFARI